MRRLRRALRVAALALMLLVAAASAASAHDCASQSDCEQTTGYISGISVIGGIIAILTGVLGSQLGGAVGGAIGGATGGATAPTGAPGDAGVAVAEPPSQLGPSAGPGPEPEVPWDELIGEPEPVDLPGEPLDEPVTPEPVTDPIDELLGEPTDIGDDDPLAGEPEIDELVPIDEPPDKVKPPILEATETGTDVAGQIKDAADTVKEFGEEVGDAVDKAKDVLGALGGEVSDSTRETVGDALDRIGDAAEGVTGYAEQAGEIVEKVKGVGEKAGEYMNALNDNLERTEQLGLTDKSRDFLGWWRVTIKAAGELTEKFVDGITSPVTKLLGEKAGEKAQDLIHDAVPVKGFGEELSKFPTSAAEHVVNASQRDQVAENVNLVPKDDAGYIELDDLYPGRKWP